MLRTGVGVGALRTFQKTWWHTLIVPNPSENDHLTMLALAARDGDVTALGQFVAVSQGDVWRLCAYLGHRNDADDLAQETFERAIGSLHRFRGDSGARPWLLTICRRVCVDATRRNIRRRRIDEAAVTLASVHDSTARLDSTLEIDSAIENLDPGRKEAFILTQLIGLPYAEAAQVLGVPVGTIRSRIARARSDLVEALESPSTDDRQTNQSSS